MRTRPRLLLFDLDGVLADYEARCAGLDLRARGFDLPGEKHAS